MKCNAKGASCLLFYNYNFFFVSDPYRNKEGRLRAGQGVTHRACAIQGAAARSRHAPVLKTTWRTATASFKDIFDSPAAKNITSCSFSLHPNKLVIYSYCEHHSSVVLKCVFSYRNTGASYAPIVSARYVCTKQ